MDDRILEMLTRMASYLNRQARTHRRQAPNVTNDPGSIRLLDLSLAVILQWSRERKVEYTWQCTANTYFRQFLHDFRLKM